MVELSAGPKGWLFFVKDGNDYPPPMQPYVEETGKKVPCLEVGVTSD